MSHKNSSKSQSKKRVSANQDESWWKKNWISLGSLLVSLWALHVSMQTDSRTRGSDSAAASAEATLIAQQAGEVSMMATYSRIMFINAQNEQKRVGTLSSETVAGFAEVELPSLAPTLDELEQLARSGDGTAGQLALCVKWRNIAEGKIELLAKRQLAIPFQPLYMRDVTFDLSSVADACAKAADDLADNAIPDPTGSDIFSQPAVLTRIPTQTNLSALNVGGGR
jgi:hypothetical protein